MKTILENPWLRSLAITCLVSALLMTTGCSGCRNKQDDEIAQKEDEKKEKRKDDFETNTPVLLPGFFPKTAAEKERDKRQDDDPLAKAMRQTRSAESNNRTKPGHWYTANFQAIANNFNADGELTAMGVDGTGRPVRVPGTDYFVKTSRPVSLPKGEWKNFETTVFIPPRDRKVASATVSYTINRSASGLSQIMMAQPVAAMKPHQFHVMLMSTRPDNFSYLNVADCIRLRGSMGGGELIDPFYYIVPTVPGKPLPLPQHSLNWTTVAYMIWDDFDATKLGSEQETAILDWLHYGGQLIISGPDCLDKLQNSFLADYLPAHFDGSRNLTNADLEELNRNWTVPAVRNEAQQRIFQVSDKVPLLGVTFKPHDQANYIEGTGEIAIERQIGRGRIAITSFSLSAQAVVKWRSYKSFLNGALLRKPSRRFGKSTSDETVFEWVDDGAGLFDPMVHSTLRYVARDLSINGTQSERVDAPVARTEPGFLMQTDYNEESDLRIARSLNESQGRNLNDTWRYGGYQDAQQSGIGGWNDNSGIANAARETLKEAAGITPPSSDFVLKMLAGYLLILVPLNWIVFRLLGKVEYAWVAAPIIAIVGALMVVKFAALDIGFVRSNTQVGLLEIHADYPRAHLAEYSALYTSLSTRYRADLDNLSAQSLPFSKVGPGVLYTSNESLSPVSLRRTVDNTLDGFQIQSNTTGLLHTEYMLDLAGVISFHPEPSEGKPFVTNSTNIDLGQAAVVGRNQNGDYQFAWVGELAPDSSRDLEFETKTLETLGEAWGSSPIFENTKRSSKQIWRKNLGSAKAATLEEIEAFPELKSNWLQIKRLLLQQGVVDRDGNSEYSAQEFDEVFQLVNSATKVSLGRLLDSVLNNLTLSRGEYRLIGSTAQRLGRTKFEPQSTQIDQQTLVLSHLQQPDLPTARADVNAFEDFASVRSNLEWEREEEEFEQMLKDRAAELDSDDPGQP